MLAQLRATIHRWVVRYSPDLLERFNQRKRAVTGRWHIDETYVKVRGQWHYLYRAIASNGDTIEFWFSERRNLTAAKCFLRMALKRHGRPERIVIDGSQTNRVVLFRKNGEHFLYEAGGSPCPRHALRKSFRMRLFGSP